MTRVAIMALFFAAMQAQADPQQFTKRSMFESFLGQDVGFESMFQTPLSFWQKTHPSQRVPGYYCARSNNIGMDNQCVSVAPHFLSRNVRLRTTVVAEYNQNDPDKLSLGFIFDYRNDQNFKYVMINVAKGRMNFGEARYGARTNFRKAEFGVGAWRKGENLNVDFNVDHRSVTLSVNGRTGQAQLSEFGAPNMSQGPVGLVSIYGTRAVFCNLEISQY